MISADTSTEPLTSASYKLSICIPTLNRAAYIGETLESFVHQLSEDVEVVIVDGGSSDGTHDIVRGYTERWSQIRFVKKDFTAAGPSNEGFDRDCDRAVSLARGEYCWLMTDDDLLVPDAIQTVLRQLSGNHDLIMACTRVCNLDLSNVLIRSLPAVHADTLYEGDRWLSFVTEAAVHLSFVGRVIIRRQVWCDRAPERYYGTGFVHAAVILSAPLRSVLVLAIPLVIIRYGNGLWVPRSFDIWMYQWPRMVWSMPDIPDWAKAMISRPDPYRSLKRLVFMRALGAYTVDKYRAHLSNEPGVAFRLLAAMIARIPLMLANAVCWPTLLSRPSDSVQLQMYDLLHCGRPAPFSRALARRRGVY